MKMDFVDPTFALMKTSLFDFAKFSTVRMNEVLRELGTWASTICLKKSYIFETVDLLGKIPYHLVYKNMIEENPALNDKLLFKAIAGFISAALEVK